MSNKDLILTIDNGTQSLRALVFDLKGDLLAKERVAFKPYFSDNPGWAEQDPEVYWQSLCQACQKLWAQNRIDKDKIAGVALTTQRGTVINVDKDGKPLRPAILWLDQRKTYDLEPLPKPLEFLLSLLKLNETIKYFRTEAEANWIYKNQPDIWNKTYKYLLLSGYLTYKLIGEFKDSIGCQVGFIPFDYKNLKWASDWDPKSLLIPAVKKNILPELVPPGNILGAITKKASQDTGIPENLPLIAAAADKACEVIGSGSLDPSVGCLSYGTTATINVTNKKYLEAITMLPAYPSAVTGYHSLEVQIFRGYWMVSWFKSEFGYQEQQQAAMQGLDAEMLFDKLVEGVPPGSMGLILQPYWTPGVRLPGPEAKGAIIGFGDVHTKAHIYRSILEGLAFALREGKERIENKTAIPITQLRISGGGSQSKNAMQVTADVFGLPTIRPHLYETSGLGAAIDAAVGLGFYENFETAIKEMTHVGDIFEPNMETHKLYDSLYNDVYKQMYKQLKPLYHKIREITGYPK